MRQCILLPLVACSSVGLFLAVFLSIPELQQSISWSAYLMLVGKLLTIGSVYYYCWYANTQTINDIH